MNKGTSFDVLKNVNVDLPPGQKSGLVEAVGILRERGVNVEAHFVGTVDEWSQASRDSSADARSMSPRPSTCAPIELMTTTRSSPATFW